MKITDNIYSLYIRQFLLPKAEDFSHPGYIYTKLSDDFENRKIRDVFIPEGWVSDIEKKTIEKYSSEGDEILYKIGKIGGVTYGKFSELKTINDFDSPKKLEEYMRLLILFMAGTYGADVDYKIEIEKKLITQSYSNFVVCPHNGIGKLVITGSATGIWAWILQDKTIKGVHSKCIGRGDNVCEIILGPPEEIRKLGYEPHILTDFESPDLDQQYIEYNQFHPTEQVSVSLDKLIESNIIQLQDGEITFHGKRFFEWDMHYIYLLEILYPDIDELYKITKEHAKNIGLHIGVKLNYGYISEFLGALGWGDILIVEDSKALIKYYPYTSFYQQSNFTIIKALISGLLSVLTGKEVDLKNHELIFDKSFDIIIS